MVCRALLKMGIELLAGEDATRSLSDRFDAGRYFSLTGKKIGDWWYLPKYDSELAMRLYQGNWPDKHEPLLMEIFELEERTIFHLQLLYVNMLVSLDESIAPVIFDDGYELLTV